MSNREEILTPVGRLVQGSLYEPNTTDAEGKLLVYKTGVNLGQPRVDFYFALAVQKGSETHWSQTEWGAKIWKVGHAGFPGGQAQRKDFAWKIQDGDSTEPNKRGNKPRDQAGFSGNWILKFSGGFAPTIYNENGTKQMLEKNAVGLGDYVQVFGNVSDNSSPNQPGVFLNHSIVAFYGYGERINIGVDPRTVFTGNQPIPLGCSKTPLVSTFNPSINIPPMITQPSVSLPEIQPIPYYPILNVPSTVPEALAPIAAKVMTALAVGTYEQYIAAGWTDALLVQHGFMKP